MTFGRDMTQIRPKNPLKKALPKAVLPKSSDKHSQDVGNLFPTFFLTGTCERNIFFYENRKFRNVVETHSWVDSSNKTSLISELVVI